MNVYFLSRTESTEEENLNRDLHIFQNPQLVLCKEIDKLQNNFLMQIRSATPKYYKWHIQWLFPQ